LGQRRSRWLWISLSLCGVLSLLGDGFAGLLPGLDAPPCLAGAMAEAVGLIACFKDVAVVRQTVQQGRGHLGITKHVAPFREVQVGRDDHAGALVELGEQVKQQRPAGLGEWSADSLSICPIT
jgi:hypothetical protein